MSRSDLALRQTDPVIANLDTARTALRKATTLQQTKLILDVAAAAQVYARRQKLGAEAIRYATGVKDEALMKLGAQMAEGPKNKGTRGQLTGDLPGGYEINPPGDTVPTYQQLGIDKKTANEARKLARLAKARPDLAEKLVSGEIKQAEAMRQMRKAEVAEKVKELPANKYRVIYADPPWSYGNSGAITDGDHYSRVERHYPSMPLADICALKVKDLSSDDAVLFLWVTSPLLFESADVIKAWGFKYKSHFVWDKVKHNFGHYTSVRHELLLICTRGSCTPDVSTLIDSVQSIERSEEHSEKPEEFRKIIDTIYPHGPRIELFRRGEAPLGWDVWGAESAA